MRIGKWTRPGSARHDESKSKPSDYDTHIKGKNKASKSGSGSKNGDKNVRCPHLSAGSSASRARDLMRELSYKFSGGEYSLFRELQIALHLK